MCGNCRVIPVDDDVAWCTDCQENHNPADYDTAGVPRDQL